MAVTASLSVTPQAPAHGAMVTATYTVTGNDPGPGQSATVSGTVNLGGQDMNVATTVTLPGVVTQPVTYAVPTCPGLTFAATGNPAVFTALVP